MPVITQKFIFRSDLQNNPNILYLFGDNTQRVGLGGQAKEMRGEPNAVGIATKLTPSMDDNAFFHDDTFGDNMVVIVEDFIPAFKHVAMGGTVVVPEDGLGSGLSDMENRCPRTFEDLNTLIEFLDEGVLTKVHTSTITIEMIMEEVLFLDSVF